ncbi:hypothetical protein ACIPPS_00210 [Streptomyces sp. NPDC090127]|uniref:hypothetical protein n=1 Tax=Streptomyces sp. NPDC090127 TaxID=3365953 RepID=UPI003801B832
MGRTGTVGRRALLAAGAVTLAGCTSGGGAERPAKPSAAELAARAEAALRRRSAATSRGLLERYDAVLATHPALAGRLTPLRAAVAAQAAALAGDEGPAGDAAPSATAPPSAAPSADTRSADPGAGRPATASSSASPAPVPADPAAALKELAAAARRTADAHATALLAAPPEYARLLASVAASGAAHAYLLTEGDRA